MKPDLLEILRCPICRGDLGLVTRRTDGIEIEEGTLTCTKCRIDYPIEDGIPDLMPPDDRD